MHFSMLEKLGFAALVAAWVVWGTGTVGDMLIQGKPLAENAYKIDVPDAAPSGGSETAAAEPDQNALELLASVSADEGANVFRKCAGCHNAEKGAANKVGPNLWNVLGAQKASHEGYAFSDALKGLGGTWTFADMDQFLASPRDYAPGTKMTYAGLKKASERAALLMYLRQQNDNPPPLP